MEKVENTRKAKKQNIDEKMSDETVDRKIQITGSHRKLSRDLYF